jgi:hypothetical protein
MITVRPLLDVHEDNSHGDADSLMTMGTSANRIAPHKEFGGSEVIGAWFGHGSPLARQALDLATQR